MKNNLYPNQVGLKDNLKVIPKGYKTSKRDLKLIIGIMLVISFIFLVSALTDNESNSLQNELDSLISELGGGSYNWLINYSGQLGDDTQGGHENLQAGCELVTTFSNISGEDWYKVCQKKKRIEEIRRLLE